MQSQPPHKQKTIRQSCSRNWSVLFDDEYIHTHSCRDTRTPIHPSAHIHTHALTHTHTHTHTHANKYIRVWHPFLTHDKRPNGEITLVGPTCKNLVVLHNSLPTRTSEFSLLKLLAGLDLNFKFRKVIVNYFAKKQRVKIRL